MLRIAATAALLGLATAALAQAPARVAALDWMTGHWVHDEGREKVIETWVGPGNGLMVAANLTTWPNGRKSFEFLRIADNTEGFSYLASPGGRSPVEFKLKELGERRVVFEKPDHDYPQRILYWRDGEALVARVEGTMKGAPRSAQWRFVREK